MAALDELRRELEQGEDSHGGYEYLRKRKSLFENIGRKRDVDPWLTSDPLFSRIGWGSAFQRKPTAEDLRLQEKRSEYYDDVNAFDELANKAVIIMDISYSFSRWARETGPVIKHAIILPDTLETIPLIAFALEISKQDGYHHCGINSYDPAGHMVRDEGDRAAITIGNQAKILIGPRI